NATVSTYAKVTAKELQEQPFSKIVEKLEEGGDRLNDDYTTRKSHTNDRRINRLFENHGAEVIIVDIADDASIKLAQSLPPTMRKMSAQRWIWL
ncbi:hypothetical protein KI387_034890, partial [Taxus chinensis]